MLACCVWPDVSTACTCPLRFVQLWQKTFFFITRGVIARLRKIKKTVGVFEEARWFKYLCSVFHGWVWRTINRIPLIGFILVLELHPEFKEDVSYFFCPSFCFSAHPDLLEAPDNFGRTPLMYCVLADRLDCAKLLLKMKCNLDQVDKAGRSALHLAAHKVILTICVDFRSATYKSLHGLLKFCCVYIQSIVVVFAAFVAFHGLLLFVLIKHRLLCENWRF